MIFYGLKGDPNNQQGEYIATTCGWHLYVQVNTAGPGWVTLTGSASIHLDAINGWSSVYINMAFLGDCAAYPVTAEGHAMAGTYNYVTLYASNAIYLPAAGSYFIYLNAWSLYQDANEYNWFEWGAIIATFYPS